MRRSSFDVLARKRHAQPRLAHGSEPTRYLYDFGDHWNHLPVFEGMLPSDDGRYPRRIFGAAACPSEDVGGPHGYAEFRRTLAEPEHPEHEAMLTWAGVAPGTTRVIHRTTIMGDATLGRVLEQ